MEKQIGTNDEHKVRLLYSDLIKSWNNNSASGFARLFTSDGNVIGFDGSELNGPKQIEDELKRIFANHKVSAYVTIVREVRQLSPTVFSLRAVAGMVPPGKSEINPKVNVIQTLIAQKEQNEFRIAIFQNTPAAFHERPDLSKQLTDELQQAFKHHQKNE